MPSAKKYSRENQKWKCAIIIKYNRDWEDLEVFESFMGFEGKVS
jgi:hypothetical protein